jgi:hypothetical protein
MTITGLLKGFQDFVSRTKPVGGTANSYKTAMGDTLVYLGYRDNIANANIPELMMKCEDLQNDFENNLQIITEKMKPFFSRAESYLTNGFVRASLPFFISFLSSLTGDERESTKKSNAAFF